MLYYSASAGNLVSIDLSASPRVAKLGPIPEIPIVAISNNVYLDAANNLGVMTDDFKRTIIATLSDSVKQIYAVSPTEVYLVVYVVYENSNIEIFRCERERISTDNVVREQGMPSTGIITVYVAELATNSADMYTWYRRDDGKLCVQCTNLSTLKLIDGKSFVHDLPVLLEKDISLSPANVDCDNRLWLGRHTGKYIFGELLPAPVIKTIYWWCYHEPKFTKIAKVMTSKDGTSLFLLFVDGNLHHYRYGKLTVLLNITKDILTCQDSNGDEYGLSHSIDDELLIYDDDLKPIELELPLCQYLPNGFCHTDNRRFSTTKRTPSN